MAEQTDELVKKEGDRPANRKGGAASGNQMNRRNVSSNARRATAVIKGASVLDGYSQDMFVPAGSEVVSHVRDKSTLEQIKEYSLGAIGSAVFNTVAAN